MPTLVLSHRYTRSATVVEANAAWASGLCGCDPSHVLPVLRRAAVPRGRVSEADQRWVRRVG